MRRDASMSDMAAASPGPSGSGAGALIRAARQAQGLHIAALAASLKVPQAKLEALEAEQFDRLPDATFARALAQSVCRVLKIDPAPVLDRLPSAGPMALDKVEGGLNTPFRERAGRDDSVDRRWLRHPVTWLVAALLLGSVAVSFVPPEWLRGLAGSGVTRADRTSGAGMSTSVGSPVALPPSSVMGAIVEPIGAAASNAADAVATVASAASAALGAVATSPALEVAAVPAAVPADARSAATDGAAAPTLPDGALQIKASAPTWIRVTDSGGRVLLSRQLKAGEAASLPVDVPLRVRVGNAKDTELYLRGKRVDYSASTRGNTASVELR